MAISDFQNYLDFDPQNFKKQVFLEFSALKSKIFKIFKKPYYMYKDTHEE